MSLSASELAEIRRFDALYENLQSSVMRDIERSVCGCDFGGTSWTSAEEADRMARSLGLRPGVRYLDLGSGCGWPALYLTKQTGCDTVLLDLPPSALKIAASRAETEGIGHLVRVAQASAAAQPFDDASFDAIGHSDLLCCLVPKRPVLAECRRVIRARGRMCFSVISVAPHLSDDDYARAIENGPKFVASDTDYDTMLAETGWTVVRKDDITSAFEATCGRLAKVQRDKAALLSDHFGREEYRNRRDATDRKLEAIRDGLLKRELFHAVTAC